MRLASQVVELGGEQAPTPGHEREAVPLKLSGQDNGAIAAGGDLEATDRDHRLGGDEPASLGRGGLARPYRAEDRARVAAHDDRHLTAIRAHLVNSRGGQTVPADRECDIVRPHSSEECQGLVVESGLIAAARGQHCVRDSRIPARDRRHVATDARRQHPSCRPRRDPAGCR